MDIINGIFSGIVDILGGTIGNLFLGIIQTLVNLIASVLISCLAAVAELFLQAMAVTPDQIEGWLGSDLTTGSWADFVTFFGLGIAMCFALWELLRGLMASIQGENPPIRPGVVGIRLLIFGAWTVAGIPFSKLIFVIGSQIYSATPFSAYTNGVATDIISLGGNLLNSLGTWVSSTLLALFGQVDWATSIVSHILGTILLFLSMWGFMKLLFTCTQRYVSLIFYTYFSPLAIACGVSNSWSRITWTWFKTLLSTIILWILDVWCIFGGVSLLRAGVNASANQNDLITSLSCLLVTYGFMHVALAFDGIMSQFGATVTKTTGSLMGDLRDMMIMGHVASGIAKEAKNVAGNIGAAATHGAGMGTAGKYKNLGTSEHNQGEARTAWQQAKDIGFSAFAGTSIGSGILGLADKAAGVPKALGAMQKEGQAAKLNGAKVQMNKENAALNAKYQGKGQGTLPGNLPAPNTPEGKALAAEKNALANKYAAKGVSIDDLANDPAVMKDMAENTLFDPKNPELGTMKENGFECVGFNPGANGAGKATFEKRDAQGNLQERREMQHLATQPVSADKDGKPLTNGMVAGAPSKGMYTGDVSRMQISSPVGNTGATVTGQNEKGQFVNQNIRPLGAKNADGSQPVTVTNMDKNGVPDTQQQYTLKPGKSIRDGAEALASGNLTDTFVSRKDPDTGKMEPVTSAPTPVGDMAKTGAEKVEPVYSHNKPVSVTGATIGGGVANNPNRAYGISAGKEDAQGNVPLAATDVRGDVVARASMPAAELEQALEKGGSDLDNAMHKAFAGTTTGASEASGTNGAAADANIDTINQPTDFASGSPSGGIEADAGTGDNNVPSPPPPSHAAEENNGEALNQAPAKPEPTFEKNDVGAASEQGNGLDRTDIEAAHPEPAHVDGAQPQESATPVVREVVAQPTTTVETTLPEPANVSTAVQQQEAQAPVAQESVAQSAPQPGSPSSPEPTQQDSEPAQQDKAGGSRGATTSYSTKSENSEKRHFGVSEMFIGGDGQSDDSRDAAFEENDENAKKTKNAAKQRQKGKGKSLPHGRDPYKS